MRDPIGRLMSADDITACLWRRPTLRETPDWRGGTSDDRAATEAELHCVVRELAEWAKARALLRLIEPSAPRRVGRLAQMRVAREFFVVPDWSAGWGYRLPSGRRMVKRFAPTPVTSDGERYIYVRSVEAAHLSPEYPWLTQAPGRGARDATVLYVNGKCFGFEMRSTREEYGVEDWRTLASVGKDFWRPWPLSDSVRERIVAYMARLGLRFGRLDFLSGDDDPTFLEVNSNGQFGWLDEPDTWPLHNAVLDAVLSESSTIAGNEVVQETPLDRSQGEQPRFWGAS